MTEVRIKYITEYINKLIERVGEMAMPDRYKTEILFSLSVIQDMIRGFNDGETKET